MSDKNRGRFPTADETPEGYDWQVVEVTDVGRGELGFELVRHGIRKEHAFRRAEGEERWLAVPMPRSTDITPHSTDTDQ